MKWLYPQLIKIDIGKGIYLEWWSGKPLVGPNKKIMKSCVKTIKRLRGLYD